MTFREKVKRVFSRSASSEQRNDITETKAKPAAAKTTVAPTAGKAAGGGGKGSTTPAGAAAAAKTRFAGARARKQRLGRDGKPKIELYKSYEVPPSKYRGPYDRAHMKRLESYSFSRAMEDRPRSVVSELSPTQTNEVAVRVSVAEEVLPRPEEGNIMRDHGDKQEETRLPPNEIPNATPDRASDTTSITGDGGTDAVSSRTPLTPYTEDTPRQQTGSRPATSDIHSAATPSSQAGSLAPLSTNELRSALAAVEAQS